MVSACSTRHQTGDTDTFQLVIPLPVQLDSQGTFVPCEARIVWYSAAEPRHGSWGTLPTITQRHVWEAMSQVTL